VSPGNHEFWFNFTAYKLRFSMPVDAPADEGVMFYDFCVSKNACFVAMDTECDLDIAAMKPSQVTWIESELASQKPQSRWLVAYGHRPLYCSNTGGNDIPAGNAVLRKAVEGTLHHGGVDLVIQGHVHDYERTWPVYNGVATATNYNDPAAPVYVVNGAAGNREGNDHAPGGQPWEPPVGGNSTSKVSGDGSQIGVAVVVMPSVSR